MIPELHKASWPNFAGTPTSNKKILYDYLPNLECLMPFNVCIRLRLLMP